MDILKQCPVIWPKAILLADMNAFFASIEQLDHPTWRARPVAVTNGSQGTCIITCSYEARQFGVRTGMRLQEARRLCPGLIQSPARPERYSHVSKAIMASLECITPLVEIFSVDEAFLDVTACQRLLGTPAHIAHLVKKQIYQVSGLHCSVGVSGDKTTAKYAAKLQKPNGLTIIPPWEAKTRLQDVLVTELCGIGPGIGRFLAQHGVYTCKDMQHLPISVLSSRFGAPGRRIWLMCQAEDPSPVCTEVAAPKSMGHGKIMPPNTSDEGVILTYLLHMSEKLAARLRKNHMQAQHFFIGVRSYALGWLGGKFKSAHPSNDALVLYQLASDMLKVCWHNEGVSQVQMTALDPHIEHLQEDFFTTTDPHRETLNRTQDEINQRFGAWTISPARLLNRSKMPNVIAPAWKPSGHRQTV